MKRSPKKAGGAPLVVLVDGIALPDDEARTLWVEFSEHMDEHRSDFAGFASKKGWKSVRPEPRNGAAVLVVTTRARAT